MSPAHLFRLLIQAKYRRDARLRLSRRSCGARVRGRAVAPVEGALLVMPGGALAGIDPPVVIGVDPVEALAEAAVALGFGETREPVVIRLNLFEPGLARRRQIARGKLHRQFATPSLDEIEAPVAILLEGDRIIRPAHRRRPRGPLGP